MTLITQFEQIDLPSALALYIQSAGSPDVVWSLTQPGQTGFSDTSVIEWQSDKLAKPTEQQLLDAYNQMVQEAMATEQKQQELKNLRTANDDAFDPTGYGTQDELIQALAQKIIWLEAEVRQLSDE